MAKTFKNLQDEILQWIGDENDTGLMRTLAKNAINKIQSQILTSGQFDFMLWPGTESIAFVAGQKQYPLHPLYLQGLFFFNPSTDEYLEEIPIKGIVESDENWDDGEDANPPRFMLLNNQNVMAQPASAGVVTITTTGGTESSSNSVVVRGVDSTGAYVEETLSNGGSWSTLTSTTEFAKIIDIIKVGSSWTRTITATRGSTTLLSLGASEYGKQYRVFEFTTTPTSAGTIYYRFYRKPTELVFDNQIPEIPEEFVQVLVWNSLLMLQGYSRATPQEIKLWEQWASQLDVQLKQTYQQSRTLGSRQRYVTYIERL